HLDSPAACRSGRAHGSRGGRHPEVVERSAEPRRTVAHLTVMAREPEPMDTVLSVYTVNMGPGSRFPGSRGSLVGTTPPGVLRRLDPAGLPAEHGALAGEPPVIAAQVAALADHAVTRHHERDRVLADRGTDRACRARPAEHGGDLRIGLGASHRNAEQRLPDAELEIRADQHDAQRTVRPPQLRIEDSSCEWRRRRRVLDVLG